MDIKEFQELVQAIRNSLNYTFSGLDTQEVQALNKRLDSDAYRAATAVIQYFEDKKNGH